MNTEVRQSFELCLNPLAKKIDFRQLIKSYLEILKESVEKLNSLNYVTHFLYFSMMQICNRLSMKNPLLLFNIIKRLYTNNERISETNRTIEVIDYLIKQFQNFEVAANTQETEKILKTSQNEASSNAEALQNLQLNRTLPPPKFVTITKSPKIGFDILPTYCIGKLSTCLRAKKILKYKLKIYKHRKSVPVERKYKGRSEIAKNKFRIRGRFVKQKMKKFFTIK